MYDMPLGMFLQWAGAVTFYFMLFWAYLPFAMAARDLARVEARYA
jgi:hypothetical protein